MRNWFGVRGAGQDAMAKRERAKRSAEDLARTLEPLMPSDPFGAFMTPEQIAVAAQVPQDNSQLALVRDMIRRRHMAVLVTLAEWQPGMSTEVLVEASGRVKELVELADTIEETVRQAVGEAR
jgi:hypothetical protein